MTDSIGNEPDLADDSEDVLLRAVEKEQDLDILNEPETPCCEYEAHPILSNQQLLDFDVRSRNVDWRQYIAPLRSRGGIVDFGNQFNQMSSYRGNVQPNERREVLIVHDMMNNYGEDRHFQSSRKYDDYRFYHWPGIDYFCYFSHHYVTIPPAGWTNAAHIHGVRMLGTFIVEHQEGEKLLREVLQSRSSIHQIVDAMVRLCNHFVFDGWLINVECKVDPGDMESLYYFIEHLRAELIRSVRSGTVFWYDSVINTGDMIWQNEINANNVRFFRLVDGMLINYTWTRQSLERTKAVCEQVGRRRKRAFFGIDVFGRNQVAKFKTRQTLQKIAAEGFSTAIFAPGWTFETLKQFNYDIKKPTGDDTVNEAFQQRNEKFWWSLWDHLQTHTYTHLPFYSDFNCGSGKCMHHKGVKDQYWRQENVSSFFNLRWMTLQPSVPLHDRAERTHQHAFNGGSSLKINRANEKFRLYATDFIIHKGGLVFGYAFRLLPQAGELNVVLRISSSTNENDCLIFLGNYDQEPVLRHGACYVSPLPTTHWNLMDDMTHEHLPLNINKDGRVLNNDSWRVRYYILEFDGRIFVRDIGVLYQTQQVDWNTGCHLGAIYCNEFDPQQLNRVCPGVPITRVPVFSQRLLN